MVGTTGGSEISQSKLTDSELLKVQNFNPLMRYNMRRAVLQKLLLDTPRPSFWNGWNWQVKSNHIGAGIYEVTGEDWTAPED